MQERRGAPFAARTVAFLFARACKRCDAPRALARTFGRDVGELAGTGGGQQEQYLSFFEVVRAGATFAGARRPAARHAPAAHGVTARGRGKRADISDGTDRRGRA